jgi:hypothetical protein
MDLIHLNNQFSFQLKSLKSIFNEQDYALLSEVMNERQRQLILATLKA